jgi:hypothetical protein
MSIPTCLVVAIGLLLLGQPAQAASIRIGPGARIDVPLKSLKDLRDENLVKQRFDYSCGAAALATILRYGFGDEVAEREILKELFDLLSEDEEDLRRKEGFTSCAPPTTACRSRPWESRTSPPSRRRAR